MTRDATPEGIKKFGRRTAWHDTSGDPAGIEGFLAGVEGRLHWVKEAGYDSTYIESQADVEPLLDAVKGALGVLREMQDASRDHPSALVRSVLTLYAQELRHAIKEDRT